MAQFTAQQLYDQMLATPRSFPAVDVYIGLDPYDPKTESLSGALDYNEKHAQELNSQTQHCVSACLIGEAGLQLAYMAHDCIESVADRTLNRSAAQKLAHSLEKCVPETNTHLTLAEIMRRTEIDPDSERADDLRASEGIIIDMPLPYPYRYDYGIDHAAYVAARDTYDNTCTRSFWSYAEYLFCFDPSRDTDYESDGTPKAIEEGRRLRLEAFETACRVFGIELITSPSPSPSPSSSPSA